MGDPDDRPDETAAQTRVRQYYEAIDDGDYATLRTLLAPSFSHDRPDRTLEGRDQFVRFMQEERPRTDTTHTIDSVYANHGAIAAQGRVLDASGTELFAFVDAFETTTNADNGTTGDNGTNAGNGTTGDNGTNADSTDVLITSLRTYTR